MKRPLDMGCDLSVGYDSSGVSPVILMCRKPAVKLVKFPGVFGQVALCEDHEDWTPPPRRAIVKE